MYIVYIIKDSIEFAFGPFNSIDEAYNFRTKQIHGKNCSIIFLRSPQ